jgi:signal transduction histidine kinase
MRMFRKLTLKAYLIAMLVVLVATPMFLFRAWPSSFALTTEISEVRGRHLLIANNLGVALERYHRDLSSAFDFASERLIRNADQSGVGKLLQNLGFHCVAMFDLTTGLRAAGVSANGNCPEELSSEKRKFFSGLLGASRSAISGVEKGVNGEPMLYMVRSDGNRLVVGAVGTTYFRELGKAVAFGEKGHAAIVDQNGRVLSHPLERWVAERRNISKVSAVSRMLSGDTGVETFYSPALKDDMIAGFTSVPNSGWGVMVPQPLSELRWKAANIEKSTAGIFLIGLLIASLAACYIAIAIATPVSRVSSAARRMAQDEADVRISEQGWFLPKEFNELQLAFNAMAEHVAVARAKEGVARKDAERANEAKTLFLRSVAHELRSPLNAIVGFADLIAKPRAKILAPETMQSYARDIAAGGRHLLSLTNDLLDLARIEAGKYEIDIATVDLVTLAERAVRFVQNDAAKRCMTISIEAPVEGIDAECDERALFQCMLNLVSNAVRYGRDDGNITVRIERLDGGAASVAVIDDGPGIAAADLERVLEPFERAATNGAHVEGTGLGLPIVCKLAELHEGRFDLRSDRGAGTQARIILPAIPTHHEPTKWGRPASGKAGSSLAA